MIIAVTEPVCRVRLLRQPRALSRPSVAEFSVVAQQTVPNGTRGEWNWGGAVNRHLPCARRGYFQAHVRHARDVYSRSNQRWGSNVTKGGQK